MTRFTDIAATDVATGFTMTSGAVTGPQHLIVIDTGIGPTWELRRAMAGLTDVGTVDMRGTLTRCDAAVVATGTGAGHLVVIHCAGRNRPGGPSPR